MALSFCKCLRNTYEKERIKEKGKVHEEVQADMGSHALAFCLFLALSGLDQYD